MPKPSWETFFNILSAVIVFIVPVALYLMEKAGINVRWIFALGWISIAIASLYLMLNIPWVWTSASLAVQVWRICFVFSVTLLFVGYCAMRIWPPVGTETAASKVPTLSPPKPPGSPETLPAIKDSVGALLTPARRGIPKQLSFTTGGVGQQEFSFEERPKKILLEPPTAIVEEQELPKEIRVAGRTATIVRFSDKGFIIDDHGVSISGKATLLDVAGGLATAPTGQGKQPVPLQREGHGSMNLKATFFTLNPAQTPLQEITVPRVGDVVTINLSVLNSSAEIAKDVDVWYRICEHCQYAEEPMPGMKSRGAIEADRQFHFPRIDPGTLAEMTTLKIRVPVTLQHFWLGMFYSCDGSPKVDPNNPQKLRVHISQ